MDVPTTTGISPWLSELARFIGGLVSGGVIVAMYRAVLDRKAQRVELRNTDTDTELKRTDIELKRLQQAKTMTEMVSLLTVELDDALKAQKTTQRDGSERLKAMQMQLDKMSEKCARVDVIEQELKIANQQLERARRNGFIKRDDQGGTGPNPAARDPDGIFE